jgi:hypothetical protein
MCSDPQTHGGFQAQQVDLIGHDRARIEEVAGIVITDVVDVRNGAVTIAAVASGDAHVYEVAPVRRLVVNRIPGESTRQSPVRRVFLRVDGVIVDFAAKQARVPGDVLVTADVVVGHEAGVSHGRKHVGSVAFHKRNKPRARQLVEAEGLFEVADLYVTDQGQQVDAHVDVLDPHVGLFAEGELDFVVDVFVDIAGNRDPRRIEVSAVFQVTRAVDDAFVQSALTGHQMVEVDASADPMGWLLNDRQLDRLVVVGPVFGIEQRAVPVGFDVVVAGARQALDGLAHRTAHVAQIAIVGIEPLAQPLDLGLGVIAAGIVRVCPDRLTVCRAARRPRDQQQCDRRKLARYPLCHALSSFQARKLAIQGTAALRC